jgi:hypothetical protein
MPGICKVNITVKNIFVHSNNQIPLPLPDSEVDNLSNAITATVLWPSANQSAVVGAVAPVLVNQNNTDITFNFDLTNPDGTHPPDPEHPAARVFRYLVLDDTDGSGSTVYIDVTATVKASLLTKILVKALGGALSAGAGLVPGGQIVTGVVQGLASGIGDWISKLSDDDVSIIGSASFKVHADQLLAAGRKEYALDLMSGSKDSAPVNWFVPGQFNSDGSPVEHGLTVLIPANTKNGSITLVVEAFPANP